MDATLTQIVSALVQAHMEIDRLRARVADLEAELARRNGTVPVSAEASI